MKRTSDISMTKESSNAIPTDSGSGVNLNNYRLLEYPPDGNINFIFIGRIMKDKGIDHYLEAAEYIREKCPNTTFHILGMCEEDYKHKLEALQERGIVEYHGRQEDVLAFHKISHCTIHPTYSEGMSNVLLESAACGRPIIASVISAAKRCYRRSQRLSRQKKEQLRPDRKG
jgi:galacturonosyltransferase